MLEERGDAEFRQAFARAVSRAARRRAAAARNRSSRMPAGHRSSTCSPSRLRRVGATAVRPQRRAWPRNGHRACAARRPARRRLRARRRVDAGRTIHALTRPEHGAAVGSGRAACRTIVDELAAIGLGPDGARSATDVRACPGLTFCSLAITGQPAHRHRVIETNARLIGPTCPATSRSRYQAARTRAPSSRSPTSGSSGTKVRLDGRTELGYQLVDRRRPRPGRAGRAGAEAVRRGSAGGA